MDRISWKRVKEWLECDKLYKDNFHVSAYDGYYHILSKEKEKVVIVEKTPRQLWESWKIFKDGYYFCKDGRI